MPSKCKPKIDLREYILADDGLQDESATVRLVVGSVHSVADSMGGAPAGRAEYREIDSIELLCFSEYCYSLALKSSLCLDLREAYIADDKLIAQVRDTKWVAIIAPAEER